MKRDGHLLQETKMKSFWVFAYNDRTHEWSKEDYLVIAIHKDSFTIMIGANFFDCPFHRAKFSKCDEVE